MTKLTPINRNDFVKKPSTIIMLAKTSWHNKTRLDKPLMHKCLGDEMSKCLRDGVVDNFLKPAYFS